mmetsp:Transcript_9053/g.27181  ORF Transcript_9053/g.27181 Transcript_9053/m.27181 type:complete len:536 (+) Transcript_9053:345-1952(+)
MSAPFRLPSRPSFPNDLRVLLLESTEDQPALAAQLRELSYTVDTFSCAREAAALLETAETLPDIVLAEASLIQLVEGASDALMGQSRAKGVPVVLMSAGAARSAVMEAIELGAVDFLDKPVSLHKLRNIWQHVVRKLMASGVLEDKAISGMVSSKTASGCPSTAAAPAAQPAENGSTAAAPTAEKIGTGSAPDAAAAAAVAVGATAGASPACSEVQQPGCSGAQTSLGSRSLDADASSCSVENTATRSGRRVLRRTHSMSAESCKPQPSSSRVYTTRSRKAKQAGSNAKGSSSSLATAASLPVLPAGSFQLPPPIMLPTASWHSGHSMWGGTPMSVMTGVMPGWQQMPAAFMPVDSGEVLASASPKRGKGKKSKASAASAATTADPPATLPHVDSSFASSLSSTLELDAPWSGLNPLEGVGGGASPCFGGSDDSLDSDFTDLMLPNDLDLDLMFGDGVDASGIFDPPAAPCDTALGSLPLPMATAPEKPPIGLALRKSESLVNLINSHLATAAASSQDTLAPQALFCTPVAMQCS